MDEKEIQEKADVLYALIIDDDRIDIGCFQFIQEPPEVRRKIIDMIILNGNPSLDTLFKTLKNQRPLQYQSRNAILEVTRQVAIRYYNLACINSGGRIQ